MTNEEKNRSRRSQEKFALNILSLLKTERITLRKKEIHLLPIGENCYVWIISSGWLLALRGNSEGHLKGTQLLGPGDIVGISSFADNTRDVPVYAMNNVLIYRVLSQEFMNLVKNDSSICQSMFLYVCKRYDGMLDELEQTALFPLQDRIQLFKTKTKLMDCDVDSISEILIAWAVGAHPGSVCRTKKNSEKQDALN